ncbi:MAG: CocE/NonD family hydrolase [Sterolibacterium sp.]|nr:CocE/NonD family hydrolase [Sterolibacterium sp.]
MSHLYKSRTLACLGAIICTLSLTACNGGSNSDDAASPPPPISPSQPALPAGPQVPPPSYPGIGSSSGSSTTLGTRLLTSQANPPIVSNALGKWRNYARTPDYAGIAKLPLQFITTRNGQKLAVLVAVPADAKGNAISGQFPVILTQNAYRIDLGNALSSIMPIASTLGIGGADQFLIRRGYISVTVDTLGSGMSDGELNLFGTTEQATYADTVNWVTQQPWSNGTIGVAGTSYLGISSLFTAAQRHPSVKTAFVNIPMGDPWRDTIGTGGMLNGWFISNWLPLTQNLSVFNDAAITKYPQYADQIKAATQQHISAIYNVILPLINNTLAGQTGYASDDGTFWSDRSPIEQAHKIQVPTFVIGSSSDIFQRNEPLLYEQLKRNVPTKMLIVPGAHAESILSALINNNNPLENGAPMAAGLMLQWFDKYLKGINSGAELQPNVTQYVNGLSSGLPGYTTSTDWPHPQAMPQRLWLRGDMSLTTTAPSGSEATHSVREPAAPVVRAGSNKEGNLARGWVVPADGSEKSISWLQWSLGFVMPLFDWYRESDTVEKLQGALNYETGTMTTDYYINGPIQADIWMSSTATEAALSVRIDDVGTDGVARPITNGLMSAAFRTVDTSRSRYLSGEMIQPWHPYTLASKQLLVPGQPVLVPVEIFPAAAVIKKGHRLRVSISASNQAQGVWNYPSQALANGGVTTIYNESGHASSVVLPVLPSTLLK